MLIRTEAPADILVIDRLLKSVFETEVEANLVMRLRENSHLTLSLVACNDEGEIVGHAMFSPVTRTQLNVASQVDEGWQGLAPLTVREDYRGQGLGKQLVEEGLISLKDFGYPACVVLGDPNYYAPLGFQDAAEFNMNCIWDAPKGAFRIKELFSDICAGKSGQIDYSDEFAVFS